MGLGLAAVLASAPALAAPLSCRMPAVIPVPHAYGPSANDPVRDIPIGSYTLALSWAPQYCHSGEGMGGTFESSFECDTKANRFGFVVHGLWPDGVGKEWPQYCKPAALLDEATVRRNLCLTPSADLLQHEWAKHGTCADQTPADYFAAEQKLRAMLNLPDMTRLGRQKGLTVKAFTKAFVAVNRTSAGLKETMVGVALSRDGWLQEVRLCLDRARRFVPCRADQFGVAAPSATMRIRPIG